MRNDEIEILVKKMPLVPGDDVLERYKTISISEISEDKDVINFLICNYTLESPFLRIKNYKERLDRIFEFIGVIDYKKKLELGTMIGAKGTPLKEFLRRFSIPLEIEEVHLYEYALDKVRNDILAKDVKTYYSALEEYSKISTILKNKRKMLFNEYFINDNNYQISLSEIIRPENISVNTTDFIETNEI